jgi:hypothetical protein
MVSVFQSKVTDWWVRLKHKPQPIVAYKKGPTVENKHSLKSMEKDIAKHMENKGKLIQQTSNPNYPEGS